MIRFLPSSRLLILCLCIVVCNVYGRPLRRRCETCPDRFDYRVMHGLTDILYDGFMLNCNLFSVDSAKIITGFLPAYISTRMLDQQVQDVFYDEKKRVHKNQMNKTFASVVEGSAFIGIVGLTSLAIFSSDDELRLVSRIFGIGAVSALNAKNIVKKMRFNGGLRPWHEDFDQYKRHNGGFPSGHMIEAAYMTTVYGLHYGLPALLPLSAFTGLMCAMSVSCNRHYLSQAIAGIGFGIIYGVAVHKLIDTQLERRLINTVEYEFRLDPSVRITYYF